MNPFSVQIVRESLQRDKSLGLALQITAVLNFVLAIWSGIMHVPLLFALALTVWLNCMIFAIRKIRTRIFLFLFLSSFFVFLLGRPVFQLYFGIAPEAFNEAANKHAHLSILIALSTVWICSLGLSLYDNRFMKDKTQDAPGKNVRLIKSIFTNPKLHIYFIALYALILLVSLIYRVVIILYIQKFGYYGYHQQFAVVMNQTPWLFILAKIEYMLPAAFCFLLSTFPSRKVIQVSMFSFLIYAFLTLAGGQRFPFVSAISICSAYLVLRWQNREISKKKKRVVIVGIVIAITLVLFLFYFMEFYRGTTNAINANLLVSILYTQGVTYNVIQNAFINMAKIPTGKFYSLSFVFSGIPAILSGSTVYQGNNVENALNGHSFAHAVSYVFNANAYLKGVGFGSSYLAESYHDFGYAGIIIWSAVFALIIHWAASLNKEKLYSNVFKLLCIPPILWAPRGETSGFITTLIAPSNIVLYLGVAFFALLMHLNKQRSVLGKMDAKLDG